VLTEKLSEAFDPIDTLFNDATNAAFDFADGAHEALDTFLEDAIFTSNRFMDTFGNALRTLGQLVEALIKQFIVAIAKALLLKAIGGFLGAVAAGFVTRAVVPIAPNPGIPLPTGAAGGTAVSMNPAAMRATNAFNAALPAFAKGSLEVPRFDVPRFNVGALAVPHYDFGSMRVVPGASQSLDNFTGRLAPGEAILPAVGGVRPGEVVARLAKFSEIIERRETIAPGESRGGFEAPLIGQLVVQAMDADSVTNQSRPGGRMYDALVRASELGR